MVHPDDPDLVRLPDPGGGRFREWLGPVLARLTPAQIEQGRTHGFWITHDTRELDCVDEQWRAELFPGPDDDWQRRPATKACELVTKAASAQGMVHLHLGPDTSFNMFSPQWEAYVVASVLHEYYNPPVLCVSDLDCLPGGFGPRDPKFRDWPRRFGHPYCPDPKVMYTSEPGGLWNAGWIVCFNTPLPARGPPPKGASLSIEAKLDEESAQAGPDNPDWKILGEAEFTFGLGRRLPERLERGGDFLVYLRSLYVAYLFRHHWLSLSSTLPLQRLFQGTIRDQELSPAKVHFFLGLPRAVFDYIFRRADLPVSLCDACPPEECEVRFREVQGGLPLARLSLEQALDLARALRTRLMKDEAPSVGWPLLPLPVATLAQLLLCPWWHTDPPRTWTWRVYHGKQPFGALVRCGLQ